jgi:hypothetical protein
MATAREWTNGYARQASADFSTFSTLQPLDVPECHKLQFLQMACEKLVKAHLCHKGFDPTTLQKSHAIIAATLPIVLRQEAIFVNLAARHARSILQRAKHLAREVELLAPAVKRGGQRPDNCEYPWTDDTGALRLPLDWTFYPSQLLEERAGRSLLKLLKSGIDRLLQ